MKAVGGVVEDASGETNMAAYVAVGVWHHWLVRRDARLRRRRTGPSYVAPSTSSARSSCRSAASPGRRSGTTASRRTVNRDGAAGRVVEHPPRAAGRADAGRAARRPAARVGARRRAARPRAARAPRPVPGQVDVLDGLVLPGARRRGPRRRRAGAAREPLGRLRRARARGALRRHQPVGDRRRDLRAGAGPRRPRRPRRGRSRLFADAQHLRQPDGGYWTGYVYPDEVHWPAEHTTFTTAAALLAHDALAGQTAGRRRGPRRRAWCPTRSRWGSSAAARQPTRSPAAPDARRSTRSDPTASTSAKAPEASARR